VPVGGEPGLQLDVVLDDPVEDDREAVVAAGQRVRVPLGGPAVGRPARVPDAGRRRRVEQRGDGLQLGELADGADELDVTVDEREAGGVVAAVLQALEPGQEQRFARPVADVADDAADR
jgi:hypothetical protein